MFEAWRSLVVQFKHNDAFEVLAASECDGLEFYDLESLKIFASNMKIKMAACNECVD